MNRIFPRTLLALLVGGAIPVLLMLVVALSWVSLTLDKSKSNSTARVASEVAAQIELVLGRAAFELTPLANEERLIHSTDDAAKRLAEMKRIGKIDDAFTEIALYDRDGYVIESSSEISTTQETTSWFQSALNGKLTRSRPFLDAGGERLCYSVYVPVDPAENSDVAVLKATRTFNRVEELIRSVKLLPGELLLALDQFGNCVGRSSGELRFERFDPEIRSDIWKSSGSYQMPDGVQYRYVSAPVNPQSVLDGDHLRLLWLTPESHFAAARQSVIQWILGVGFAAVVPLSLLGWWLARSLSLPLIRVATGARLVAGGDLNTELEPGGIRELGDLARSFNAMVGEVRRRASELETVNKDLERSGRLKDQFLATMSHELRTPLHSILGFSEALQSGIYGQLSETQHDGVHQVKSGGEMLLAMVDDILDLAKLSAGKIELQAEDVRLSVVCGACASRAREKARAKSLRLTDAVDDTVVFTADRRRVEQILDKLFDNAIKFTPKGGEIHLYAYRNPVEEDEIVIRIADTGIGIDDEHQKSLFHPFVQLDSDLGREYGGTGIGLAIVRELAELHGGSVELLSTLGKGSTFTVRLPAELKVEHPAPTATEAKAEVANLPEVKAQEVVLIEENELKVIPIRRFLQSRNHIVRVASNGGEGIEFARRDAPDLIVLDAQSTGIDLARTTSELRLASGRERLSIIALTSAGAPELLHSPPTGGPDRYLAKPLQFESLENAIRDLLSA